MPEIGLVPHQHNDNVTVCMVPQLLQPPIHILIRRYLADIVDQQRTHGSAVVCGGDGAIALLAGGIPDLGFDGLGVDLDGARGELDPDGRFGVEVEFVAGEAGEEVGFSDAGISN
jgi:hypothetical protein